MKAAHVKAGFVALLSYPVLFVLTFYGTMILIAKVLDVLNWHPKLPDVLGPVCGFSAIVVAAWLAWRIYKRALIYFENKPSLFHES